MTTEIKYQLLEVTGPNTSHQVGDLFSSEMTAKVYALSLKDKKDREYKIASVITTHSIIDIFTAPAHVPTLSEIAQDIISCSDGSFYMEWGEDFERLDEADQSKVQDMVYAEIDNCADCGWHFHVESMENIEGDTLCWKCEQDREEEEEEDESDED